MPNRRLNIAYFTDTYYPQINGVVRSIEVFRQQLEKLGHQIYIFAPSQNYKSKREGNIFYFPSTPYAFQPEYRFAFPLSWPMIKEFPDLDIDIIHTQTLASMGMVGNWVAKIKKIPLVFTYHTLYPEYIKTYFAKFVKDLPFTPKLIAKVSSVYCNKCDVIIVPSEKVKELIKSYGVTKRIEVIKTGLELERFVKNEKINIRKEYNIPKDAKVLTCIARLGQEKNMEFLVKTFVRVNQKEPNTYLFLISDGPDKKKLQEILKTANIKNVVFAGYMDNSKVIQVLLASDLFIFSSLTETQGIVIAEALACGLPLVVVDDSAFHGVAINNVNALVTPADIESFSAAIIELLKDEKKYNQLKKNCRDTAEKLSAENETKKLLDLYDQFLKE